jgi:hypothetical protein
MFLVNLGKYRGKRFKNSKDTEGFIIYEKLLSDGTPVTIKHKHQDYNWVMLNEDTHWYPMDLLRRTSKTYCILRLLK